MMRSVCVGLISTCLVLAAGCSCSDESGGGLRRQSFPRLEVDPESIVLSAVPIGETTHAAVRLRNTGGATLRINALDFSNGIDTREFVKEHPALPIDLTGGEEITLQVNYSPKNAGTDAGWITVQSNDVRGEDIRIPVSTNESRTQLVWSPDRLIFVSPEGEPLEQKVKLQNFGTVPVEVLSVRLSEDTDPEYALATNAEERPTLARDDSIEFGVIYTPQGQDQDVGTLLIEVDDPSHPLIEVPLLGDEPSPQIHITPESISFGAVDLMADSDPQGVLIENRGTAPLKITAIEFAAAPPGVNEQFRFVERPEITPDAPLIIAPEETAGFTLLYNPQVDGRHRTGVSIHSNDADEPLLTVPVSGRVRKPCIAVQPEAVSLGRVALAQQSAHQPVSIINCGDLPVHVSEINLDGAHFSWEPGDGAGPDGFDVPPLGVALVHVWYDNVDLAEGDPAEGTLTVTNDTVDTPEVVVPIAVAGGGAPTCDLLVIPDRVNFGLVSRGTIRARTLNLVNRGTGQCEIREQSVELAIPIPIPGLQVSFILTRPVADRRVAPGQFAPFEVAYRPQTFSADQARFVATYWDPFRQEERQATAMLTGVGGDSTIEVIPGRVDFGRVTAGECASREERVTVYNTGIVDLCINGIRLEGDACDEFLVVDRPVADADGCITVTRNTPADVRLVYEPTNLGGDTCDLVFESDANNAQSLRVPLSGEGIRDRRQTDVFEQTSGRKVDILFVVDNSGSMQEEQRNLSDSFGAFIRGAQQFQNDYQIGITTTDMDSRNHQGRLQGDPRIFRRNPNVEAQFQDTVDVGTNGAGDEKGLEAANKALSDPLAFDTGAACNADADCVDPDLCVEGVCGGFNRGFLRPDAALEVIFVSDEEDHSPGTLNFYVDFLKNIKGFRNDGLFHAHAIVGAENGRAHRCSSPAGDASPGARYVEAARRTNGGVFSICDEDFSQPLRDIGNQAFGLPVQFFLSRPAIPATLSVTVDGQIVAAGPDTWSYDEESNSVVFTEQAVPQGGQTIQVDYEAQCFARRGE